MFIFKTRTRIITIWWLCYISVEKVTAKRYNWQRWWSSDGMPGKSVCLGIVAQDCDKLLRCIITYKIQNSKMGNNVYTGYKKISNLHWHIETPQ